MSIRFLRIDRNSPIPIYHQLEQALLEMIEAGEFASGQSLPSETELSRKLSISPMTVRQSMSELVKRGVIRREKGRGTFVMYRHMEHKLDHPVGFSEDIKNRQMKPGSRTLLFETTPVPEVVVERGLLSAHGQIIRIKRVRLIDDAPVGIHDSYVNDTAITQSEIDAIGSLYALLESRGLVIFESEDTIDAVAATKESSALLHVPVGAPLMRTTRFAWDAQGHFVEYVVALYRADLYQYRIRLKRT